MTTSDDFEEIRNFFSSYFNEDWPEEAEDPMQVISTYLAHGWNADDLRVLAKQIQRFANSHPDDEELEHALFSELGSYYTPSADKISARTWLQDVASTLTAAADRSES